MNLGLNRLNLAYFVANLGLNRVNLAPNRLNRIAILANLAPNRIAIRRLCGDLKMPNYPFSRHFFKDDLPNPSPLRLKTHSHFQTNHKQVGRRFLCLASPLWQSHGHFWWKIAVE